MANDKKYPETLSGLYKNNFSDKFILNSMPIAQEYADKMCAAIQAAVGGRLELREWGGTSKAGNKLPEYKLDILTPAQLEERKVFGAAKNAERAAMSAGDSDL